MRSRPLEDVDGDDRDGERAKGALVTVLGDEAQRRPDVVLAIAQQRLEVDESLRQLTLASRAASLERKVDIRRLLVGRRERLPQPLEMAGLARRGQELRKVKVELSSILADGRRAQRRAAIEIEHSTIPLYLTAMYSIVNTTSWAYGEA